MNWTLAAIVGVPTILLLLAVIYYAIHDFGMDDSEPWIDVQVRPEWDEQQRRVHPLIDLYYPNREKR